MGDFYRDDQVRDAQAMLGRLRLIVPEAIVLGGWAVFLYTQGQRSTDVDIALDFAGLARLQEAFPGQISRNVRLGKYELRDSGVEVDILVTHFSNAGIPLEALLEPVRSLAGFQVISLEGLLAMKLCAWMDRWHTPKGRKDEADIIALLIAFEPDWDRYGEIIAEAEPTYAAQFPGVIARVATSMDERETWRFIKINGESQVRTVVDWRATRTHLAAIVPPGA